MICIDETVCAQACDVPCNGKCKCEGYVMSGQGPSSACVLGKNRKQDVLKALQNNYSGHGQSMVTYLYFCY